MTQIKKTLPLKDFQERFVNSDWYKKFWKLFDETEIDPFINLSDEDIDEKVQEELKKKKS